MYCKECGKEIPDDAKFCKHCGKPVSKNKAQNNVEKAEDKRTNTIIIVATIIIVVAIIGGVAGYLIFNSGENYSSDETDSNSNSNEVSQVSLSAFPVSEAPNLSQEIANSGQDNSITFKGVTLDKSQICYVLSKAVVMINNGQESGTINIGNPSYAQHPSGADVSQSVSKSQYVDMCNRFSKWIENHGRVPNYNGINTPGVPDVSPSNMINICVEILLNYKNTGSLPSTATV